MEDGLVSVDASFVDLMMQHPDISKPLGRALVKIVKKQQSNLKVLKQRGVIDDVERWMHPDLAEYIYARTFQKDKDMIFTTGNDLVLAQRKQLEETFGLQIQTLQETMASLDR